MTRPIALLMPVALFLALALPLAASWDAPGDEGVTFNQALGPVLLEGEAGATTPFRAIAPALAGPVEYGASDVLLAMRERGMHPPAYALGIHLWTRVFGTSPLWLRMPGIVLGLLSIVGIWAVTREMLPGSSAAAWAATLLAASLTHLHFAVYLRPYALELPLMIGSLWLLVRLRAETEPRREAVYWAGFVTVSVLGTYTLYHYAFFLAWQLAVLLAWAAIVPKTSRTADLVKVGAAGVVIGLAFAPWLGALAHHMELTATRRFYFQGFPAPETLLPNAMNLIHKLVLGGELSGLAHRSPVAELAFLTALILGVPLLRTRAEERRRDLWIFWLSVPLLPAGILFADYLRGTHTVFLLKTTLALLPLAIVALAVGARSSPSRAVGTGCLVVWLAILLAGSANHVRDAVMRPTWQGRVAAKLRTQDARNHVVVFSSRDRRFLHPMLVTLRDAGVEHLALTVAGRREIDAALRALLRERQLERVSLVSFGDDEGWDAPARERALTVARLLGWRRVRHGVPSLISLVRPAEAPPGDP